LPRSALQYPVGEGSTSKAIVQNRYGSADVLELREVEKPVASDLTGPNSGGPGAYMQTSIRPLTPRDQFPR
jgi:hypothetical protein